MPSTKHTHLVDLLSWVLQSSKSVVLAWVKMANTVSFLELVSGNGCRNVLDLGSSDLQSCRRNG